MSEKRIVVTGGAGFIGFHTSLALKQSGHFVICVDNFNDYYDVLLKKNRAHFLKEKGIECIELDITNKEALENLIEKEHISHIVHLAAQAGVRHALKKPDAYIHSNINGFLQILEICRQKPHIHLTYASSSSVYGLNSKVPFSIDDRTDLPANLYGATKKANELMASSYHHLFGVSSTALRFFTVYGPWGRPDMAYFSFTKAILESRPIDIYNFGKMKRDFTYIDDIVSGILSTLDLEPGYKIFNLGNAQQESIESLIQCIEDQTGKKAIKNFVEMQKGEMVETAADIQESQRELKFFPKTSLATGIQHFVSWYRSYYNT